MPHASFNGQQPYFEDTGGDGPALILSRGFPIERDIRDLAIVESLHGLFG